MCDGTFSVGKEQQGCKHKRYTKLCWSSQPGHLMDNLPSKLLGYIMRLLVLC